MKRSITLLLLLLCIGIVAEAQIQIPVKFKTELRTSSANKAELVFTGVTDNGWHFYSTNLPSGGPSSAIITIDTIKGAEVVGVLIPGKGEVEEYDNVFEMKLRYFEKKGTFTQIVKINDPKGYIIKGRLTFSACNNENCLPPTDVPFEYYGSDIAVSHANTSAGGTGGADSNGVSEQSPQERFGELWTPVIEELNSFGGNQSTKELSWLFILVMGFLGGLLALFTPCVWPIIPMTVSFFLKRSKERKKGIRDAWIYGASIIVIYVTLGLIITVAFGASALNAMSTNAVFNLFFFLLLVIFGVSFLGLFELTLPASWVNSIDNKAEKSKGMISIFLMAFTLALVSFSCTGPIIGFLLVEVSTLGNILGPAIGMFGFALALSLPFTLFALFPTWLNSAPKSGGWMTTLKVILGFIELAFAFKFLSVVDLAYGWGILDREVFLMIWILLSFLLGVYLVRGEWFRKVMSVAAFAFAAYMVPGLWGAPCKAVSAFAPPMYTQTWNIYNNDVHAKFNDYDKGMEYAASIKKPVLLDFTGYGCVNCRKMEAAVWTDPKVREIINDRYVLITLFVDNKSPLKEPIEVAENGNIRKLRTYGDKWSYLQRVKFGANAQPFYILVDNAGYPLAKSHSYDEDVKKYVEFLMAGLEKYEKI